MGREIDEQVVSMKFDNKQFMDGTAETMSQLDKLKQSLKLSDATKGLQDVDKAANDISLSPLGSAAEAVQVKFSALGSFVHGVFERMGAKAFDTGSRIVSALTIDPVKTGLSEYETQINAVQTILANTESKGTTLTDVNSALDQLNAYADKTIYNFTEMTRNIGTFTAAGVDLDTSVNAIQGIANLAAVSGSTSQQASTAMYQLSQALSSGTVKLMDWNSVVNAGMGGQVFQDALKETARVHGVEIDEMIEDMGSFRETLSEGWLTSDILTETLSHFTMAAEEGTEQWKEYKKSLMDSGYTEEQAEGILKLSNTATNAATKVKTFTQLMDTLKESLQSGWTQTWEIIIGDFEEAKEMWTKVSDTLGGIINASAEARNALLQGWADGGGRDMMIDSFKNLFEALKSIVTPIKEAFREIFPATTVEKLLKITEAIKNFTSKLILSEKAQEKLKSVFKGLFAILDIGFTIISAVVKGVITLAKSFSGLLSIIFGGAGTLGDWISKLRDVIKSSNIFTIVINGIVSVLVFFVKALTRVVEFIKESEILTKIITGIANVFKKLGNTVKTVYSYIKEKVRFPALEGFLRVLNAIWSGIKFVFSKITAGVGTAGKAFIDAFRNGDFKSAIDIFNSGIVAVILINIKKFLDGFKDLKEGGSKMLEGITGVLDSVRGCFEAYQSKIKAQVLMEIAKAIALLVAAIIVLAIIPADKVMDAVSVISVLFMELMGTMALLMKLGSGALNTVSLAGTLIGFAIAVLLLTTALKKLSKMDIAEMSNGFIGLALLAATVTVFAKTLTKTLAQKKGAVAKCAGALLAFSAAVRILVKAVKDMSSLSWTELAKGLIGVGALMAMISIFIKKTSMKQTMKNTAIGVLGMALAIKILASACKDFGDMSWEELAKGVSAISILMISMGAAMKLIPEKTLLRTTVCLIALVATLKSLVPVVQTFASMSIESLAKGVITIGVMLGILAASLKLMQGTLTGAAALLIAAAALNMIAIPLRILGTMNLTAVGIALLALAGAFAVFGIAAMILAPLGSIILTLAASIALMGAGMLMASLALGAFASGLVALAGVATIGSAGIIAALSVIIVGIIGLIPLIVKAIAGIVAGICQALVMAIEPICTAIAAIIVALCDAVIVALPKVIECITVVLDALIDLVYKFAPKLIDLVLEIIYKVLVAISQNLGRYLEIIGNIINELVIGLGEILIGLIDTICQLVVDFLKGVADACEEYIPDIMEAFVDIGEAILDGIIKGLTSIGTKIWDGVKSVGSKIKDGFCNFFGIKSPAKEMEFVGQYIDEGIVVGLEKYKGAVAGASEDVGESAVDSMSKAISGIADVIDSDIDSQPVIKPVLDLSEVESSANSINGMFGMTPSVDVLSNVGSLNSMMGNSQNGENFDIISAIKDLGSRISGMSGNTYNINGITYDDGSNVANAVESLVRAARIERRA